MVALQGLEEGLGLQARAQGQLPLDPGPNVVEGVLACAPGVRHAYLAWQPVELPVCPCGLAVDACLGSGQRERHTLLERLAQELNLLVLDHRGLLILEERRW
jgi:hypothetical protein